MTDDERYIIDGLDVREEFARLLELREFTYPLMIRPPELVVARYGYQPNTLGRGGAHRVKLNFARDDVTLGNRYDRFDVMEVLLHELVHTYTAQRYHEPVRHDARFWRHHDAAFQEAHGPLTVAPRTNRYHGRYAEALRRAHLDTVGDRVTASIEGSLADQQLTSVSVGETTVHAPVGWDHMPQPLTDAPEPEEPLSAWLDGRNHQYAERVGEPIGGRLYEPLPVSERVVARGVNARQRDRQVLQVALTATTHLSTRDVAARLGITLGQARHALWRLRNAGDVESVGRGRWRAVD